MDLTGQPDGILLARFASERSEACFEEIVRRHGPMVLNVCGRVLGRRQDSEDAAQAVFLALAQKAASLAGRPTVAGWLHRVARGVALNARQARSARNLRERNADLANAHEPQGEEAWSRLEPILDGELEALPERYRLPIVLCHLEGRSLAEVSAQLQCKQGTLESRLTRGRRILRDRLERRGVTIPAATLGALLSIQGGAADLPAAFATVASNAACLVAAGQTASAGAIPTHVLSLSQGAQRMLFFTKAKSAAAAVAAAALIGGGALFLAYRTSAEDGGGPEKDALAKLAVHETMIQVNERGHRTMQLPLLKVGEGRPTDPFVGVFLTKQNCVVTIGGKRAELTDLKDGDRVRVAYEREGACTYRIERLAGPPAGGEKTKGDSIPADK